LQILVVENKWLVAERWAAQLKGLGHTVVGLAEHGRDAVLSASRLEPELVIIGTQIPLIDGIETARAILAQKPVPLIVLTSYATADFVRRAREAGVMGHLVTPVESGQLGRAIDEASARFRELETVRGEVNDLKGALEIRNCLEQAKRALMGRLKLTEAEAFRRIQQESKRVGTSLGEGAAGILRAEHLLFQRGVGVTRILPSLLSAIRRGLLRPPAVGGQPAAARPPWPPRLQVPRSHPTLRGRLVPSED
jgi:AmiR/NasT family two-component response regulator